MTSGNPTSPLLVDEYFASQDARFLDALRACPALKPLAALADRWKKDPRPWARQQLIAYLNEPLDSAGHQALVKRLFKHAEAQRDDELMASFMVAFDRLIRRRRETQFRWDREARQSYTVEALATPRDVIPLKNSPATRTPRGAKLFSHTTRHYIRRRAWRYFRRMGFQRAADYPAAIARALRLYRDADLLQGENILDSWSLVRACFWNHASLNFGKTHANLNEGQSLSGLVASPRFPELWQKPEAAALLVGLLVDSHCQLVRVWAVQLLRQHHPGALADLTAPQLLKLLDHDNDQVQELAAELLAGIRGVERWPVSTWMALLKTRSPLALQAVCDAMTKHVSADRLDLPQCAELATALPSAVAKLGLAFLRSKTISTNTDRLALVRLASMRCEAVAGGGAAWALSILGTTEHYDVDQISRFFDSISPAVREAARAWLTPQSPGYSDALLWSRLLETPYEDVRLRLIDDLDKRAKLPGKNARDLTPLWTNVLLGIHRGGRQKLKALRQISYAVAKDPGEATALLPVLAVAMRSVRPAEARAGLAAVVAAVESSPAMADAVKAHFPELAIAPEGATR